MHVPSFTLVGISLLFVGAFPRLGESGTYAQESVAILAHVWRYLLFFGKNKHVWFDVSVVLRKEQATACEDLLLEEKTMLVFRNV